MASDKHSRNAPAPSSPVARLQKVAKRAKDEGGKTQREEAAAMDAEGKLRGEKCKAEASAHASEALEATQVSSAKRQKMTDAEQSAEFERVAKEHGAEGDETEFNGVLRKLAKPKTR